MSEYAGPKYALLNHDAATERRLDKLKEAISNINVRETFARNKLPVTNQDPKVLDELVNRRLDAAMTPPRKQAPLPAPVTPIGRGKARPKTTFGGNLAKLQDDDPTNRTKIEHNLTPRSDIGSDAFPYTEYERQQEARLSNDSREFMESQVGPEEDNEVNPDDSDTPMQDNYPSSPPTQDKYPSSPPSGGGYR